MLTRAAREQNRRLLRQHLLAEYSQLSLPWLCPAVSAPLQSRRHVSTRSSSPRPATVHTHRTPNTARPPSGARQIATALDPHPSEQYPDPIGYGSFGQASPAHAPSHDSAQSRRPHNQTSSLPTYDPSNFIFIPDAAPKPQLDFKASARFGVAGDVWEIQQNLYACVQIGRLDRAAVLAQRLTRMLNPTSAPVIDAHHRYLSGLLDQLQRTPSHQRLMEMQKWLELDIRARGVPVGHGIIAIMLKASLVVLTGSRLSRTIRRYAQFAQDLSQETYEDTLSSDIFSEQELKQIVKTLRKDFATPHEELSEEDIGEIDQANRAEWDKQMDAGRSNNNAQPLPTLKPVELKGLGLEALRKSLGSLSADYLDDSSHAENVESRIDRQMRLEQDVAAAALERWRMEHEDFEKVHNQGKLQQAPLGSQIHNWIEEIVPQLEEDLKRAENGEAALTPKEDYDIVGAAPFLNLLSLDKVAAIAVLQFFAVIMDPNARVRCNTNRITVVRLCERMGMTLFQEARIDKIQTHYLQTLSNLPSAERHKRLSRLLRGKKWSQRNLDAQYAKMTQRSVGDQEPWIQNHAMVMKCGAVLLGLILKTAKLTTYLPDPTSGKPTRKTQALGIRLTDWRRGKRIGAVEVPSELLQTLKKEPVASLVAKHLPMIVPPKPWTNLKDGAYLTTPVNVLRFSSFQTTQKAYVELAHKRGDMDRTYAGLDVISKTPWRVNKDLFQIMSEVWNSGERMGKIVPDDLKIEMPPRPDTDDPKILNRWKAVVRSISNDISSNHSQRCYQNFQLEVARAFANTTFYCPQNMDYRGRAYPIPPYFNHTGADHVRALFNFAEGKQLGTEGLFWLKVQLANAYGYDKASMTDRVQFVNGNVSKICESATDPLHGSRWWLDATDPWQTLAACLDLKAALDLPDPTKHVSYLPIQQDGSCNGLQHYAALGGDEIGARQVNLTPGDKPADIYTAVMEAVADIVHQDALAGNKQAQAVDGHVTRKMVKQPVMTNVYGVTYHGATHQVAKQLREIIPESQRSLDPGATTYKLAAYVALCIFKALSAMFTGAQAIQIWLGECGARISSSVTPEQIERVRAKREGTYNPDEEARKLYKKSLLNTSKTRKVNTPEDTTFKSTIVWTTPLGLPVVQPYRDFRRKVIRTHLQNIVILTPTGSDPVNKRKQLQGFPPNFIHSLDATHMMLSALKCDEIGLTFSSVHDSFWTHAADVPTLNKVLRDAFVSMHKEDIIRRLKEEFEARYAGCFQWTSVKLQSPLGAKLEDYYKTSKSRRKMQYTKKTVTGGVEIDDMLEEAKRTELLRSENPEQREEGEQMVTAASIVADMKAGDDQVYSTGEWGTYMRQEDNKSSLLQLDGSEVSQDTIQSDADPSSEMEVDAQTTAFDEDPFAQDEFSLDDASASDDESSTTATNSRSKKSRAKESKSTIVVEQVTDPEGDEDHAEPREAMKDAVENVQAQKLKVNETRKKTKPTSDRIYFWMPLTFPEPPPKGKFDVTCLRESRYFFS